MLGVREERVKYISNILEKFFEGIAHRIIKDAGTAKKFLNVLRIGSNGLIIKKVDRLYIGSEEGGHVMDIDGGIMLYGFVCS